MISFKNQKTNSNVLLALLARVSHAGARL